MKVSETLELVQGADQMREYLAITPEADLKRVPPDILKNLNDPEHIPSGIGIGLGIHVKTKEPIVAVIINYNSIKSYLIGNEIVELVEYVQNRMPEYGDEITLALSFGLLSHLKMSPHVDNWVLPPAVVERLKGLTDKHEEGYRKIRFGSGDDGINKTPTSDNRELTTIRGVEVLKMLSKIVPTREDFVKASKKLLQTKIAMAIIIQQKDEKVEDTTFIFICRLNEPTNDPLEADLLCMSAFQPDVLRSAVMFNPDINEIIREGFTEEFDRILK